MGTAQRKKIAFSCPTKPGLDISEHDVHEQPSSRDLLAWALWYRRNEIDGVGSRHTVSARTDDLQKFVNYFYRYNPDGSLVSWTKGLSQGFLDALNHDGYSRASVARIYTTVKSFARYPERKKVIDSEDSPVDRVKAPPPSQIEPRTAIVRQGRAIVSEGKPVIDRMIEAAASMIGTDHDARELPYRNVAVISTLYFTGLRVSEVCGLDVAQLRRDRNTGGAILHQVLCKGGKRRDVFVRDKGTSSISEYLRFERDKLFDRDRGPLFVSCRGQRMTRSGVWRMLKRIAAIAQVSFGDFCELLVSPHVLRHERAIRLLDAGFSESAVAEELGQSDTRQIRRYTKPSDALRHKRLNEVD